MTNLSEKMQLALRDWQGTLLLFALWILLTVVCALSGPFGTHDMLALGARAAYWSFVVGASIWGSTLPARITTSSQGQRMLLWMLYAFGLTVLVFMLNSFFFDLPWSWQRFAWLFGVIGVIVCAVHFMLLLIEFARPETSPSTITPELRFLRRLPVAVRGPLVRIEAQDHYLNVVTENGATLILLRLGEAVEELQDASGLQVHRSHWVATAAVASHRREKGRDVLVMSDGTDVPVSRSNRGAARAIGLF